MQGDDATEVSDSEESEVMQVSGSETEVLVSEATGVRQQKGESDKNSCVGCEGESTVDEREIHSIYIYITLSSLVQIGVVQKT